MWGARSPQKKIQSQDPEERSKGWADVNQLARNGLLSLKDKQKLLPIFINTLHDEDMDLVRMAWDVLENVGEMAVPGVARLLDNPDARIRANAAQALGRIGHAAVKTWPLLVRALEDQEADVRYTVLFALSRIGALPSQTVPLLTKSLSDTCDKVRARAANMLADLGADSASAVPALTGLLKDTTPEVRQEAVKALGKTTVTTEPLIPALIESLGDEDGETRKAAAKSLSRFGTLAMAAIPSLTRLARDSSDRACLSAIEAIWHIDRKCDESIPALIDILRRGGGAAEAACDVISNIGPAARAAVPSLVEILRQNDYDLAWAAADTLEAIGPVVPETIPVLIETLINYPSPIVRCSAASVLKKYGVLALSPLLQAMSCSNPSDRGWLLDCIAAIGPAAKEAVAIARKSFEDPDSGVRFWAAIALAKIDKARDVVSVLVEALKSSDSSYFRAIAAEALAAIGHPDEKALRALNKAVEDPDERVRNAAKAALDQLRMPK